MYKKFGILITGLFLVGLLFGMGPAPIVKEESRSEDFITRVLIEQVLGELEYSYANKDIKSFMLFLDNNSKLNPNFPVLLENYYSLINNPHLHFVIDMIVNTKEKIWAKLHWYRLGVTSLGVKVSFNGSSVFIFKKSDKGLKLMDIKLENPFF